MSPKRVSSGKGVKDPPSLRNKGNQKLTLTLSYGTRVLDEEPGYSDTKMPQKAFVLLWPHNRRANRVRKQKNGFSIR